VAERIQKLLAAAGIASRREAERLIEAGRVSVNGNVISLGDKAELTDTVRVDGKIIRLDRRPETKHRVLAYHKPEGQVCTRSDPEGRPTIFDHLPRLRSGRWINVGRLDINTSGLVLLTTDGELANRLMHPSHELEREYAVRVLGEVDDAMLRRLRKGVELEDGMARFNSIRDAGGQGANHWYHVTLHEGRNREVRRLWGSQEVTVSRLSRVRYGPVNLRRGLKPGQWDELTRAEIEQLRQSVGMTPLKELTKSDKPVRRKTSAAPRSKKPVRARQPANKRRK
jgi:23S rRNA pseudouridine2605 synthase